MGRWQMSFVVGDRYSRRLGDELETWRRVVGAESSPCERASARGTGTKKQPPPPPPRLADMAPMSESAIGGRPQTNGHGYGGEGTPSARYWASDGREQ